MTSKKIGDFLKNIIVLIIRMIVTNPKVLMTDMLIFVTNATISTSIDDSTAIPTAITKLTIEIYKYHAFPTTIPTLPINIYKYYAIPDLTTPGRPIPAQGEMAICSGERVITFIFHSHSCGWGS